MTYYTEQKVEEIVTAILGAMVTLASVGAVGKASSMMMKSSKYRLENVGSLLLALAVFAMAVYVMVKNIQKLASKKSSSSSKKE